MKFHWLLFKTISARWIPTAMRNGVFLVHQVPMKALIRKPHSVPLLTKPSCYPLRKYHPLLYCLEWQTCWWWQKLKSHWILEGDVSWHATLNSTSSGGAFQSLTLFTEFLLSAKHRRHVKMTKAGSLSTRRLRKSEDDTSRENAAWNIARGIGMKFENPDVMFPYLRSHFHPMAGINVTAEKQT